MMFWWKLLFGWADRMVRRRLKRLKQAQKPDPVEVIPEGVVVEIPEDEKRALDRELNRVGVNIDCVRCGETRMRRATAGQVLKLWRDRHQYVCADCRLTAVPDGDLDRFLEEVRKNRSL